MTDIKQILYFFNERNLEICNDISSEILEFPEIDDYLIFSERFSDSKNNALYSLKRRVYGLEIQDVLFRLLEEKRYNINYEVKEFIRANRAARQIDNEKEVINTFLFSPYIDGIASFKDGIFIKLKDVGDFCVYYADNKYRKKRAIYDYIKSEELMGGCHKHVEFLVRQNPELYSITSLCAHLYEGLYFYHSYCYDEKKDEVIDLTLNLVMKKQDYDKLFKNEELFMIQGKHLSEAAHIAVSYDNSICRYYTPLASTLFQQYIWENNLESPDKSLFSEEPSNKGVLMKNRIDVRNKK